MPSPATANPAVRSEDRLAQGARVPSAIEAPSTSIESETSERERNVRARHEVVSETTEKLESSQSVLLEWEAELVVREDAAAGKAAELDERESRAALPDVEPDQLREANEQLVVSVLRANDLAEEAVNARMATELSQRELAESELALREASQRKDEFLAMLGHELRNPLAPILTALDVITLRGDDASLREHRVIERQVRHMVGLIDDLLDVSRVTSGKLVLHPVPIELSTAVAAAIEATSPLLDSRHHTLVTSVPESGLLVSADPVRLAQVIANVLTNAAKYTDPGGRVEVTATRDGAWAVLSVSDNGTGIAAELLPTIFDRFVQAEQTIDRARGGLGLGLAIVKSLVELHGGEVAARSDGRGRGSQFIVRMPIVSPRHTALAPVAQERGAARERASARRVLVVDDNVDAVEMLGQALAAGDHEIAIAHDGPEALRLAESFAPDAVVIDIGLPVMDGYELARRLREREAGRRGARRLRLVALTGYGQDNDRARSAAAGIDVHLVKPVDLRALEVALTLDPDAPSDLELPSE